LVKAIVDGGCGDRRMTSGNRKLMKIADNVAGGVGHSTVFLPPTLAPRLPFPALRKEGTRAPNLPLIGKVER
jgi:hypothetical protein